MLCADCAPMGPLRSPEGKDAQGEHRQPTIGNHRAQCHHHHSHQHPTHGLMEVTCEYGSKSGDAVGCYRVRLSMDRWYYLRDLSSHDTGEQNGLPEKMAKIPLSFSDSMHCSLVVVLSFQERKHAISMKNHLPGICMIGQVAFSGTGIFRNN